MAGWGSDDELIEDGASSAAPAGAWGANDQLVDAPRQARRGTARAGAAPYVADDETRRSATPMGKPDPRRVDKPEAEGVLGDAALRRGARAANPDPMLRPEFIDSMRQEVGALPEQARFEALRALSSGASVRARAARVVLGEVQAANQAGRDEASRSPVFAEALAQPSPTGRRPAAPAASPALAAPELGRIEQLAAGRTDGQELQRQAGGRNASAANTSAKAFFDRAEVAQRDFGAEKFAADNPTMGALVSGAAQQLRGAANVVPTVVDFAARLAGLGTGEAFQQGDASAALERAGRSYMPKIGSQPMEEAWGKGEFGGWLMTNVVAQAPQIAQSMVAAFVPGAQGLALGTMGAIAASNKFADTGRSDVAVASGAIEAGSEMLPLQALQRSFAALRALPPDVGAGVAQAVGRAFAKAGTAVSTVAVTGAIEEVAAQIGNNALDIVALRQDKSLLDGVASAAVLGGAIGGGMAAPGAASFVAQRGMAAASQPTNPFEAAAASAPAAPAQIRVEDMPETIDPDAIGRMAAETAARRAAFQAAQEVDRGPSPAARPIAPASPVAGPALPASNASPAPVQPDPQRRHDNAAAAAPPAAGAAGPAAQTAVGPVDPAPAVGAAASPRSQAGTDRPRDAQPAGRGIANPGGDGRAGVIPRGSIAEAARRQLAQRQTDGAPPDDVPPAAAGLRVGAAPRQDRGESPAADRSATGQVQPGSARDGARPDAGTEPQAGTTGATRPTPTPDDGTGGPTFRSRSDAVAQAVESGRWGTHEPVQVGSGRWQLSPRVDRGEGSPSALARSVASAGAAGASSAPTSGFAESGAAARAAVGSSRNASGAASPLARPGPTAAAAERAALLRRIDAAAARAQPSAADELAVRMFASPEPSAWAIEQLRDDGLLSETEARAQWRRLKAAPEMRQVLERVGSENFDVPGRGTVRVPLTAERLAEFRRAVVARLDRRAAGTGDGLAAEAAGAPSGVAHADPGEPPADASAAVVADSIERAARTTGGVYRGSASTKAAIVAMIDDGDPQAAVAYAADRGVDLAELSLNAARLAKVAGIEPTPAAGGPAALPAPAPRAAVAEALSVQPHELTQAAFLKAVEVARTGSGAAPWTATWRGQAIEADPAGGVSAGTTEFKTRRDALEAVRSAHRRAVERAQRAGQALPPAVLDDYPALRADGAGDVAHGVADERQAGDAAGRPALGKPQPDAKPIDPFAELGVPRDRLVGRTVHMAATMAETGEAVDVEIDAAQYLDDIAERDTRLRAGRTTGADDAAFGDRLAQYIREGVGTEPARQRATADQLDALAVERRDAAQLIREQHRDLFDGSADSALAAARAGNDEAAQPDDGPDAADPAPDDAGRGTAEQPGAADRGTSAAAGRSRDGRARIDDAGQKIGGARKDRWRERAMTLDDLGELADGEAAELVNKANALRIDYAGLVSAGSSSLAAAGVKIVVDRLAARPRENTPAGRRRYVEAMQAVQAVYSDLSGYADHADPELAAAALRAAAEALHARLGARSTDNERVRHGRQALFSVYRGRSDPFAVGGDLLARAGTLVDKGFPGAVEPWTRRFEVERVGGPTATEDGIARLAAQAAELGSELKTEDLRAGAYRVKQRGTVGSGAVRAMARTRDDAHAAARLLYEAERRDAAHGSQGDGEGRAVPVRPHLDVLRREGLAARIDRDASPEDLLREFGFRGVEFGNWSAQDERQRMTNLAFDALADLAAILGVPPAALSLDGTLGLAFGARGAGQALAHYEPGKLVINLTKLRGGGSLAHEFAHALDHYLGELGRTDAYTTTARGASGWRTRRDYGGAPERRLVREGGRWRVSTERSAGNLRDELAATVDAVMRAIYTTAAPQAELVRSAELALQRAQAQRERARTAGDARIVAALQPQIDFATAELERARAGLVVKTVDSSFAEQAKLLSGRSGDYWSRPTEMFARAFESFVFDRLVGMGASSHFLVHGVEDDRFAGGAYRGNPYPTGEERAAINRAFGELLATLKTRPTERGTALFQRGSTLASAAELNALQAIADTDELFALPRPRGTTVEDIAAEIDPTLKVRRSELPNRETMWRLTAPDGTFALVTQRAPSAFGQPVYGYETRGDEEMPVIGRPGENPDAVLEQVEDVYVDVSHLAPGGGGTHIYAIAAAFAHNTGRIFIGDPAGLSDQALVRRPEQMLSSALKYGTTRHLAPHPRQVVGDAALDVPALRWVYGDDVGNIRRLVELNVNIQENAGVDIPTFDPDTGTFSDGPTTAPAGQTDTWVRRRAGDVPGVRGAGSATLARVAVLRALLRREGETLGGAHGRPDGLLAQVARLGSDPRAVGLFYDRTGVDDRAGSPAPVASAERLRQVRAAADRISTAWEKAPAIEVLASMDDAPLVVREADRRQREAGAVGSPSAFTLGGRVYLLAAQLATDEAIEAAVLHEALGHVGLRGVFGDELEAALDEVVAARRSLVAAKAAEYGLDINDAAALREAAEEVLAELAETQPELGAVRRAVAAIRQWLRTHLPALARTMRLTDDDLIARYILPARDHVVGRAAQRRDAANDPRFQRTRTASMDDFRQWMADNAERPATAAPAQLAPTSEAGVPDIELPGRLTVDGIERPTHDERGEPLATAAEGVREFWRWFGSSPMVDAEGRPRVLQQLAEAHNGQPRPADRGTFGAGVYLTPDGQGLAELTAGARRRPNVEPRPAFAALRNPYRFEPGEQPVPRDLARMFLGPRGQESSDRQRLDAPEVRLAAAIFEGPAQQANVLRLRYDRPTVEMFRDRLHALGHDGLIVERPGADHPEVVVAFDAERVRHAEVSDRGQPPLAPATNGTGAGSRPSVTDTPEFRRWFGRSVVVNPDGSPRVMYHGTAHDINAFQPGSNGDAIFVSPDPEVSSSYSGESLDLRIDGVKESLPARELERLREQVRKRYAKGDTIERHNDYTRQRALANVDFTPEFKQALAARLDTGPNVLPLYVRAENPFDFERDDHLRPVVEALAKMPGEERGKTALQEASGYPRTWSAERVMDSIRAHPDNWTTIEDENIMAMVRAAGHDGFWITEHGRKNLAVYSPSQLKSAIGNSGAFDSASPDIRFQRTVDPAQRVRDFELRDFGRGAVAVEAVQDRFNRWKQSIQDVRKQGGTVTDANDFYRAEERYWGTVGGGIEAFKAEMKRFVKAVRADGASLDGVALYAYAQHAEERNELIASRPGGMTDGGSGMTTEEADDILAAARQAGVDEALARHARTMRQWVQGTRDVLFDGSLIAQDERDAWERMFRFYVPLRGVGEAGDDASAGSATARSARPRLGSRLGGIRGAESERADGRSTQAAQIIEHIANDRARALIRSGRNAVLRSFAQFVVDNPSPKLWEINAVERRRTAAVDADGEHTVEFDDKVIRDERTIALKDGGDTIHIVVHDAKLLEQLQRLGVEEHPALPIGVLLSVNRWLSRAYTTLSPVFTAVNALRDTQAAAIGMVDEIGLLGMPRLLAQLPAAWKESMQAEAGRPSSDYELFTALGGRTAFHSLVTIEEQARELAGMVADAKRLAVDPRKALPAAMGLIESLNGGIENATRLAAFKAARASGKTDIEAVSIAKNITVNFNRRGTMTTTISAWVLFFNPAVQGSARAWQALKSKKTLGVLSLAMMGVAALAVRNAGMGEDDDGVAWWDKIPDDVKERNIVIVLPPGATKGDPIEGSKVGRYTKIPMPYGYNFFAVVANQIVDVVRHSQDPRRGRDPVRAAARAFNAFLGAWVPGQDFGRAIAGAVLPEGKEDSALKSAVLAAIPDALDPLARIGINQDGFGKPLRPGSTFDRNKPDSATYFSGQHGNAFQRAAEALNAATGGTRFTSGAVDIAPSTIEHLLRSYGGGMVGFTLDIVNALYVRQNIARPELDAKRLPFAKQFYGVIDDETDRNAGYERLEAAERVIEPIDRARRAGAHEEAQAMREAAGAIARLGPAVLHTRQQLSALVKQERAVVDAASMSDDERYARLVELRARRRSVLQRFTARHNDAVVETIQGRGATELPATAETAALEEDTP